MPDLHHGEVRDDERAVEQTVFRAFAPMDKRALGIALGAICALLVAGVTALHVALPIEEGLKLYLLSNYFYGYDVTWGGVLAGGFWSFVVGFVAGWFAAFVRNLVTGIWVFAFKHRTCLERTAHFLDHI